MDIFIFSIVPTPPFVLFRAYARTLKLDFAENFAADLR